MCALEKTDNVLEIKENYSSNNLLYYFNKNVNTEKFFIKYIPKNFKLYIDINRN